MARRIPWRVPGLRCSCQRLVGGRRDRDVAAMLRSSPSCSTVTVLAAHVTWNSPQVPMCIIASHRIAACSAPVPVARSCLASMSACPPSQSRHAGRHVGPHAG